MSRHGRRALMFAVVSIVLAAAGLAELGRSGAPRVTPAMARQVVLLRTVKAGETLDADALAIVRIPSRYAATGRVDDPRQAIGRQAAVALPAGSPLAQAELADPTQLEAGRLVAVRLDDAAGLPAAELAGARADLLLARPSRAAPPVVVLANVVVVSAGRADGAAVATLRLPAAAVAVAVAAEGEGSLRLAVRVPAGGP